MSSQEKSTSLSLLERVRGQDQEAWQRLIHLYGPLVARWCSHRCVRPQDAEDVQQEVFHAVATSLHKFRLDRPGDTFRGWLRGITKNKLLDHYRRRHGQPEAQGGPKHSSDCSSSPSRTCRKTPRPTWALSIAAPWSWSAANSKSAPGTPSGASPSMVMIPATSRPTWA